MDSTDSIHEEESSRRFDTGFEKRAKAKKRTANVPFNTDDVSNF